MAIKLRGSVVGINRYQDIHYREKSLLFARADAEEMAAVLHRSNALQIEKGELNLLINEWATQENVWRDLNRVFATGLNFDENTIAFFYFAGHGVIDPIEGDSIILGCHDVAYMNPNKGGVRLNDIYRLVQRTSAGCSIAIIDACFSGDVAKLKRVDHESPAQIARKGIALLQAEEGKTIAIFAACSADQVAREDQDVRHGVYTNEFLRGLRDGEARDESGAVDLNGMVAYLSRRFAEDYDWQGPRSTMVGGRPVVLSYGEPRTPGSMPVPEMHPRTLNKLTSVDGRNVLPTRNPAAQPARPRMPGPQKLVLPALITVGVLLLSMLTYILFTSIPLISLMVFLIFSLVVLISSFRIHSMLGIILTIVQLCIISIFVYNNFHPKALFQPAFGTFDFSFLGDLLWLFWVVVIVEILGLGASIFRALTR